LSPPDTRPFSVKVVRVPGISVVIDVSSGRLRAFRAPGAAH
jgi:hypothetical protein